MWVNEEEEGVLVGALAWVLVQDKILRRGDFAPPPSGDWASS